MFIGTYIGSKDFRDAVSGFRIYTVRFVKGAGPYTGISQFLQRLIVHKSVDEHLRRALQRKLQAEFIHRTPDLAHEFTFLSPDHKPFATMQLRAIEDGAFTLSRLTFERSVLNKNWTREDFKKLRRHFAKLLFPYGLDIRDAALTSFDEVWNHQFSSLAAGLPVAAVEYPEGNERVRWCKKNVGCEGDGHGEHDHDHDAGHHHHHEAGHHHGHEGGHHHHHSLTVVRDVVPAEADIPHDVVVDFLPYAVQIRPVTYFRLNKALREIPAEACEVAATYRDAACLGLRNLGTGSLWLISHPQYVVYGPVKGVVRLGFYGAKAGVKTVKIGLQVIQSAVGILVSIAEGADNMLTGLASGAGGFGKWLKECGRWIVTSANSGDDNHPSSQR